MDQTGLKRITDMSLEIEKKFSITPELATEFTLRLEAIGADYVGERFEQNLVYSSSLLHNAGAYVRLRVLEGKTEIAFKQRVTSDSGFKTQLEYETEVDSFEEIEKIIEHLGVSKRLMYEKRRKIWKFEGTEVVLDELPFGLFMEIEGTPEGIVKTEAAIGAESAEIEIRSYPMLTTEHGRHENGAVICVFEVEK